MMEKYIFVGFLVAVMGLCIASGFVRNQGNNSRYTKIKIKGRQKFIFDVEANEWILWSVFLKRLEDVDTDYIEQQFQYCSNDATVIQIDCEQYRALMDEGSTPH